MGPLIGVVPRAGDIGVGAGDKREGVVVVGAGLLSYVPGILKLLKELPGGGEKEEGDGLRLLFCENADGVVDSAKGLLDANPVGWG